MNLRVRLNLLITAILLIFFVSMGYTIMKGSKESIQEGVESANRVTMQLLDTVIINSSQNPEWGYTHHVLKRFLEELGHVRSSNISCQKISYSKVSSRQVSRDDVGDGGIGGVKLSRTDTCGSE